MDSVKKLLTKTLLIDEGFRTKPYVCTAGKMTIGVGRNFEDNPFTAVEREALGIMSTIPNTQFHELTLKPLSEEQVQWLLGQDLDKLIAGVETHPVLGPIYALQDPVRQVAILNLVYNMGINTLLGFKHFLAAMFAKDYSSAEYSLKRSRWNSQVGRRAGRVRMMVKEGTLAGYPN